MGRSLEDILMASITTFALEGTTLVVNGSIRRPLPPRSVALFAHFNTHRGQLVTDEKIAGVLEQHGFAHSKDTVKEAMAQLRDTFTEIGSGYLWTRDRGTGWKFSPPASPPVNGATNGGSRDGYTQATPVPPGRGRRPMFYTRDIDFNVVGENRIGK
ncbi:hypothetical protein C4568_02785 [Candidatus Parcubacteria bacterium]|nr:MAG: hypothetical protein C4568_02785 [Candidatus Parcubacteria bacterium]